MTCAMTSLAPQLTGVMTGRPVSGGMIDTMSKLGPTLEDLKGLVTLFMWILNSFFDGALVMGLKIQSLVRILSQLR